MTGLLIATTNRGKVAEFRRLLPVDEWDVTDLSAHPGLPIPEETGRTFLANACLKATYYAKGLASWTLADDSGLAVDALAGSPGVHSARWAAMHDVGSGDQANNTLLLKQMEPTPASERGARFICALALSDPNGRIILTTSDWVTGRILTEPRGTNGFGYDPLFYVESQNRTTAELDSAQKDTISHRGKAMRRIIQLMQRAFKGSNGSLNP